MLAAEALHESVQECLTGVNLVLKPVVSRNVWAQRDFKKGELVLVPMSMVVDVVRNKVSPSCFNGGIAFEKPKGTPYFYSVQPKVFEADSGSGTSEFLSAYWFVQNTPLVNNANMKFIKVNSSTYNIEVMCLMNLAAIKAGTQLLYYNAPGAPKWAEASPSAKVAGQPSVQPPPAFQPEAKKARKG